MSIVLNFLLNVCVGAIGIIAIVTFACLITFCMGIFLDFITTSSTIVRKVWDIGIMIIFVIILVIFCYGTGVGILEKFL